MNTENQIILNKNTVWLDNESDPISVRLLKTCLDYLANNELEYTETFPSKPCIKTKFFFRFDNDSSTVNADHGCSSQGRGFVYKFFVGEEHYYVRQKGRKEITDKEFCYGNVLCIASKYNYVKFTFSRKRSDQMAVYDVPENPSCIDHMEELYALGLRLPEDGIEPDDTKGMSTSDIFKIKEFKKQRGLVIPEACLERIYELREEFLLKQREIEKEVIEKRKKASSIRMPACLTVTAIKNHYEQNHQGWTIDELFV